VEEAGAYSLRPVAEEAAVVANTLRQEVAAVVAASTLRPAAVVAVYILRPEAAGANLTSDYLLTPLSRRVTRPRNCG
jgi:hypothetical protein